MAGHSLLSSMITLTTGNIDCPDFQYGQDFGCRMSPDGSKVAVSLFNRRYFNLQTYILGITSGSSEDIMDLMDARKFAWFPDSKRIAYIQSWQCEHGLCGECCDLVVQRLASGQITTIHRWYNYADCAVLVTPDGSRVVTNLVGGSKQCEFRTWDVSDL